MARRKKVATMKDVAKIAGVSIATVSRALMKPDQLSLSTLQKVQQAISVGGYVVKSPRIHSLSYSGSSALLVAFTQIDTQLFTESIPAIQATATKQGYCSMLLDCSQPKKNIIYSLANRLAKHIEGIVLLGSGTQFEFFHEEPFSSIPKIVINEFSSKPNLSSVHIDHLGMTFNSVTYLYQQGHQRIAYLCGPENAANSQLCKQGYIQALSRWGIALEQNYVLASSIISYQAGIDGLNRLMSLPQPPSAIVCYSDIQAIGVLYQAKKLTIKVPQALSVIGCGDIKLAKYVDPPLTTVAIPHQQMAKLAIIEIVKQLQSPLSSSYLCLLESELVIRATTAPFRY